MSNKKYCIFYSGMVGTRLHLREQPSGCCLRPITGVHPETAVIGQGAVFSDWQIHGIETLFPLRTGLQIPVPCIKSSSHIRMDATNLS